MTSLHDSNNNLIICDNDKTNNTAVTFTDLPLEIIEYIISLVPDPVNQARFSQVCKLWNDLVLRLRWLKLVSFERRILRRLPYAGSLHEKHGNHGFSLLLSVMSPVLIAGAGVFLPYRENLVNDISGEIFLYEHGATQVGPNGKLLLSQNFQMTREEGRSWQENCNGTQPVCLQGPWQEFRKEKVLEGECYGLHPLPVMFTHVQELKPEVRYLMTLKLREMKSAKSTSKPGVDIALDRTLTDNVGTVWGFQGVPRRKNDPDQNFFRWYQLYRSGHSSSVSSGQFPIIYYIA